MFPNERDQDYGFYATDSCLCFFFVNGLSPDLLLGDELLAVLDEDTLGVLAYALACEVEYRSVSLGLVCRDVADAVCSGCELEAAEARLCALAEYVVCLVCGSVECEVALSLHLVERRHGAVAAQGLCFQSAPCVVVFCFELSVN